MAKYVGARLGPAESSGRTGLDGRPLAALRPMLDSLVAAGLPLSVVGDVLPDTPKTRAMLARVGPALARYRDIGARTEADYVATDAGVEWLTSATPRGADEVEALAR